MRNRKRKNLVDRQIPPLRCFGPSRSGRSAQEVNVGNQAPIPGTKHVLVTRSVAVTAEQAPVYRAIAEKVGKLTAQTMVSNRKQDFLELLDKSGL